MRAKHVRLVALSILVVLAATVCDGKPALGQDAKAAKTEAPAKARKAKAKAADQPSGRLPSYYAKVVDEKQKVEIYRIQQEYKPKIAALKAQLGALTKEQDEKIAALLTPDQQKKVEEAKAAAAKNRSSGASAVKPTTLSPVPATVTPAK
jgi:hypothetical protein